MSARRDGAFEPDAALGSLDVAPFDGYVNVWCSGPVIRAATFLVERSSTKADRGQDCSADR